MRKILYFFLLCLASCSVSSGRMALKEAEQLIDSLPDSALSILNSKEKDINHYSKKDRMAFLLLKAEAMNKSFTPMDTIKFMGDVLDYYKGHGNATDLIKANYLMGCVYRDKGDSPLALKFFLDAVSINGSSYNRHNDELVSRAYGQIGLLYHQQRIPQREIGAWKKCMHYSLLCRDTLPAIQALEYTSFAYSIMNQKDSALSIAERVYSEYRRIGETRYAASSLGTIIAHNIEIGNLDEAKKGIDEYITSSGLYNPRTGIEPGHEIFYSILGKYYEKKHQLDSADYYYRKLISSASDISSLESGYHGLLRVSSLLHNTDSVLKYASLFAETNDSANIKHSADEINRTEALYDYSESQKIAKEKAKEADKLRLTVISLTFIIFIVLLLIYIYTRSQRNKRDKELREINTKYSDALIRYYRALKERESLELGLKKVKADKDEEISELKTLLSAFSDYSNKDSWDAEQSLMDHEIVRRIHKHAAQGAMLPINEWNDLIGLIEKILPDFYNFISRVDLSLTLQEKVICVLTRLHFIPTEIATLLNLTKQRISNLRRSLNKKIFNQEGSKTFTANIYRV